MVIYYSFKMNSWHDMSPYHTVIKSNKFIIWFTGLTCSCPASIRFRNAEDVQQIVNLCIFCVWATIFTLVSVILEWSQIHLFHFFQFVSFISLLSLANPHVFTNHYKYIRNLNVCVREREWESECVRACTCVYVNFPHVPLPLSLAARRVRPNVKEWASIVILAQAVSVIFIVSSSANLERSLASTLAGGSVKESWLSTP